MYCQTLTLLNLDISCSENSVDPDQLASRKPADQDLHCFLICKSMLIKGIKHSDRKKIREECGIQIIASMIRVKPHPDIGSHRGPQIRVRN